MIDRIRSPLSGQKNGRINDHISDLEQAMLSCLQAYPGNDELEQIVETVEKVLLDRFNID